MATRITTQLLDSISEESVLKVITPQFEERAALWNKVMKGEGEDVTSRGCRIPLYLVPSASDGFTTEDSLLPIPTADEDGAARVRFIEYRKAIEITWSALLEMEKKGTIGGGLMKRVTRHYNSAFKFLSQMLYGSGDAQIAIATTVSGNTVTCASSTAAGSTFGSRKAKKNQRLQFFNANGDQIFGGGITVSTVQNFNRGAHTIIFDAVPTDLATAISGGVVRIVPENSFNRGLRGFAYHFSNGNEFWQTLSRADYGDLRAVIVPASGSSITVALFLRLDQEMKFRVDEGEQSGRKTYIMAPEQIVEYELLAHATKRADMKETKVDLGFKEHEYNGNVLYEDVDAPKDIIFEWYEEAFKKFERREFGLMKEGSGIWKDVPGFTNGEGSHYQRVRGYVGWDGELGCVRPGLLGAITGLAYTELGVSY
ncbi:MAG: hypothetical protein AB1489_24600 [Acidobacteriota bacterium]